MSRKRKPNPATKYGRKRIREEMDPEVRKEAEQYTMGCFITGAIIMCIVLYFIGGSDAVIDWLTN